MWQSCPAGTFSPNTGLANVTQCITCTGGFYCGLDNLTAESGPCDAGYFCRSGSDSQQPPGSGQGDAGILRQICSLIYEFIVLEWYSEYIDLNVL